jgi:hypothetical protein|nr:hypothetical protein JVH1_4054 [Rhodococcus sp. JVH1]
MAVAGIEAMSVRRVGIAEITVRAAPPTGDSSLEYRKHPASSIIYWTIIVS